MSLLKARLPSAESMSEVRNGPRGRAERWFSAREDAPLTIALSLRLGPFRRGSEYWPGTTRGRLPADVPQGFFGSGGFGGAGAGAGAGIT